MIAETSEFFKNGALCYYFVKTYEENDELILNITFTITYGTDVYFIYKKLGDLNYTEDKVELLP
jgi:hypothetical protein